MYNNSHYWIGKNERSSIAKMHTDEMKEKYNNEINDCIKNTVIYSVDTKFNEVKTDNKPNISISSDDTVSAIFSIKNNDDITILNFASYRNPGGGFLKGSSAQEESLCHSSFLYNVLMWESDYYEWNNNNKNRGMYLNRALYSPNVKFLKKNKTKDINVITCAAPNKSMIERYGLFTEEENTIELKSRIHFIKNIAESNNCKTLILGAYGCGVFRQDPTEVAEIFKKEFETTNIENIIYAIPAGANLNAFKKVLS